MPARTAQRPGAAAHVSGFLAALAAYFGARFQLLGLEAKEAAIHYAILIALLLVSLVVVIFGYFFLCFFLVFGLAALIGGHYTWIWITLGMAVLHFGGAAAAVFIAKTRLSEPMFAATLHEFKKDQEWLTNVKTT